MTATQSARWTSSKRRPASPEFFIKTSEAERTAFCLVLLRSFLAQRLQVQHAVADLLGSALVPVLGADVAARPARDVHLRLVGVAALRAGPDELAVGILLDFDLAVEAADLAVV